MTTFKIDDQVIVSDAASLNHGAYGTVSGTSTVYGYDEVLVELDRDGTTHKFDASQLTPHDQPDDDEPWDECPDQFYAPTIVESYVRHAIEGQAGR